MTDSPCIRQRWCEKQSEARQSGLIRRIRSQVQISNPTGRKTVTASLVKKWWILRNDYFGVYHDARRLILEVGLDSDAGQDAADAYEIAEVRYQVLDSVLSVMQAASWHDLLPIFRGQKRSVAT